MSMAMDGAPLHRSVERRLAPPALSVTGHMRQAFIRSVVVACLGVALPCLADERILYKSIMPNGQVVYGDAPEPDARRTDTISVEPHPADPKAAEAAQRALDVSREQFLRDAAARASRLKELDKQIVQAQGELQDRQAKQAAGRQAEEGERQGRRLTIRYGQRQRTLALDTEQARRKLDKLIAERDALRY